MEANVSLARCTNGERAPGQKGGRCLWLTSKARGLSRRIKAYQGDGTDGMIICKHFQVDRRFMEARASSTISDRNAYKRHWLDGSTWNSRLFSWKRVQFPGVSIEVHGQTRYPKIA